MLGELAAPPRPPQETAIRDAARPSSAPPLPAHTPRSSNTLFCVDKSVTAVVIQGLAEHKDTLGAPLCPCRHYDDKEAEAANGFCELFWRV